MMVSDCNSALKLIEERKDDIERLGVVRVGIFGSFVRGEQTGKSDIDLLVEFGRGKKSFRNYIDFVRLAEDVLGREVDVLTLEAVSPHLASYIKKEVRYVETT